MVRRSLIAAVLAPLALFGCERQEPMADSVDMPDTMAVQRAMEDPERRDALLDTMPGGEMVHGDSSAVMDLLDDKMLDGEHR